MSITHDPNETKPSAVPFTMTGHKTRYNHISYPRRRRKPIYTSRPSYPKKQKTKHYNFIPSIHYPPYPPSLSLLSIIFIITDRLCFISFILLL